MLATENNHEAAREGGMVRKKELALPSENAGCPAARAVVLIVDRN